MNHIDLIGQVTTELLHRSLESDNTDPSDGVSRFLLDRLTGEQVASICKSVLEDPILGSIVEIKVPRKLVDGYDLPSEVLTDEKTTFWRNAPCDKEAIILANISDDQEQSLRDITLIGARDLKKFPNIWVGVAAKDLPLIDDQKKYWEKALSGLQEANDCSLEQFSNYVAMVHDIIASESIPTVRALGWALPALRISRDSTFFESIPEKSLGYISKWRQMFANAYSKRGCYLQKQNPNRQAISNEEIWSHYQNVKDQISEEHHDLIKDFIKCKETWSTATDRLAELEWESDNIGLIFSGLRVVKLDLPTKTIQFFNDEYPDVLSNDELQYLESLRKRKGARDEDKDFYENHRHELETDSVLRSQWEKFVYGKPIECTDFLVGLITAIQRLFAQCEYTKGNKELRIRTSKGKGQRQWLDINEDVGLYFCAAHRGIEKITNNRVIWDTNWLFKYDELIALRKQRKEKDHKPNTSTSKSATRIQFQVDLIYTDHQGNNQKNTVPLVWHYPPAAIGLELFHDLSRLCSHPFLYSLVGRNQISKKGKLQNISLSDVDTMQAVYGKDRGSLVSTNKQRSIDINKVFVNELKRGLDEERLSQEQYKSLHNSWAKFSELYAKSISSWKNEGISSELLIAQVEAYKDLLDDLRTNALRDINRISLWHPVIKLGNFQIEGNNPTSIIAPWHPLRMAEKAVKVRQVAALINYVLTSEEVNFGDPQLFFTDLCLELSQPYYPEITVGFQGEQAHAISVSDTVNDYSLMESPVRVFEEHETNEDPNEATEKVLTVVKKYIDLQPHEKSNLSVALFNCDSTRLPQSVVSGIAKLNDEDEVRCQVILRHRDLNKLGNLYMKMIESADRNSDLLAASEVSKDFMARLRIGVMADAAPISNTADGKPVDIVYLQDVISREAKLEWVEVLPKILPRLLEHVPPRWGKRKSAAKDELKSTAYLVSPSQPYCGWAYLRTLYTIVEGKEPREEAFLLPARQISFQNEKTRGVFEEAHTLGEWVINSDSLLEPRLLKNQGVQVIKYQHSRTQGASMVVSSKSQLSMLKVLVKRRLAALNLSSLNDEDLIHLTQDFIDDANNVSGDIVLRAAKRGVFASELLGVVLSKTLIASELPGDSSINWFFLDDYASWLGQKEEQIADILALSPHIKDGQPRLTVIISEAKYVDAKGVAEAKRNSQKQLRDTVFRINNAIFGAPGRLDRDLWLSRLSDLLNDGTEIPTNSTISVEVWREGIRKGTIPIELKGYSHIFVSSADAHVDSDRYPLNNVEYCYQEVYSRDKVRELVLAYVRGESILPVREHIGDEKPWLNENMRIPFPSVNLFATDEFIQQIDLSDILNMSNTVVEDETGMSGPKTEPETKPDSQSVAKTTGEDVSSNSSSLISKRPNEASTNNHGSDEINTEAVENWAAEVVNTLRTALISYSLQAKVLGKRLTPNAVIVRLKGSDQLKIEDIEKKRSQLLTTHAIDVINILAQPGEIVVSIARPERETIPLTEVWKHRKLPAHSNGMNMSFVVGIKEMDGEILYLNLGGSFAGLQQHAPHTLVAGETGSGKSVLVQNLILDICATNSKELAKIYLIDPKFGVDYLELEGLPHLAEGIIIDQDKAISTLEYLVEEMDRRYLLFRDKKVNSLNNYNNKMNNGEGLPLLFLIHDEFAEWMLVDSYKQAISSLVQRLGVKARAAGIHLIFATQRPDANVLPVQLRDNLGNRLILKLGSVGTSEISLGEKGAERLLGKGHLVARLSGEPSLIYVQVPFLSSEDISKVAHAISADTNV